MSLSTQRTGQLGVNAVERVVLRHWASRWQSLESHNDDGLDGFIFFEAGGEATGQVVYVQVKCMRTTQRKDGCYIIPINARKLRRNLQIWRKVVGAAIVVLVDPETLSIRWVDARQERATTASQIIVPEDQFFDNGAKSVIKKLCGTLHSDALAPAVHTFADDFQHITSGTLLPKLARTLYKDLNSQQLCCFGQRVHFDRVGWRHITRRTRSRLSRMQSLSLLGAVPKIIKEYESKAAWSEQNSDSNGEAKFYNLDAMVSFPFRQTGLVRLVLRQLELPNDEVPHLKFWTIYEPRRKLDVIGAPASRHP